MRLQHILFVSLVLTSCSNAPEKIDNSKNSRKGQNVEGKNGGNNSGGSSNSGGGSSIDPLEADPSSSELKLIELVQDPSLYTFGSIKLSAGLEKAPTKIERSFYAPSGQTLSDAAKKALTDLCGDVNLTADANGELNLSWRAHTSLEIQNELYPLASKNIDLRCVLSFEDEQGKARQLALEVLPSDSSKLIGSDNLKDAATSALMPLKIIGSAAYPKTNLTAVTAKANFVEKASILKTASIKAIAPTTAIECSSYKNDSSTDLIEPTLKIVQSFESQESKAKLGTIIAKAIAGRIQPSCAKVMSKADGNSIKLELTCADYQAIQKDGSEAACEWQVAAQNSSDPGQSVGAGIALSKVIYKTVTANNNAERIRLTPKYPDNQIRSQKVQMVNSTPTFIEAASTALDMWIGSSPELYYADFHNYMKTITYSTSGSCAGDLAGGGGYAYLNSTAFTWCGGGDLLDANLKNDQRSPFTNLFQVVILSHETRHARGWNHDIDNKSYEPCTGSAKSQVVLHDIATKCTLPFCKPMKKNAIDLYISDMKYNLPNDARRNQGQCAQWNKNLGLTDASF